MQAMTVLSRRYEEGAIKIRQIAEEENLPEKFLELILLELKNARLVESVRGANGGYRLRRMPAKIFLSEIIRLIDGPLAPFGDAASLRELIATNQRGRALYKVFMQVRDATAKIIENTSLADITDAPASTQHGKRRRHRISSSGGKRPGAAGQRLMKGPGYVEQ